MEEAIRLLEQLASKIGVAIETLWPATVRYMAIRSLIQTLIPTVLMAVTACVFFKVRKQTWFTGDYYDEPTIKFFAGIALLIFLVATTIASCEALPIALEPAGYLTREILRGR